MAQPRNDPSGSDATPRRGRFRWVRWLLGAALVALLTVEAIYLWPTMSDSWRALTELHWGWFAACVVAQMVSLSGFAGVQQRLLRAGGVRVGHLRSASVVYSSTAMAVTLPAGPVFSTAFTYKQTRKWGATPVVASWQLAVSGVIAATTLAAVGVGGAFAVGSRISPVTLVLSIAGVIALFYGLRYVARNPSSVEALGIWVLTRFNRIAKKPAGTGFDLFERILAQLEAVDLARRDALGAIAWSAVHRASDVACLGLACWAVGGQPSVAGLLIAFAAAKAVGSVPLAPGGLGFVDGTLIATLAASGMSASQSLAAVFVYRVVSFAFVALAGWSTVGVLYRDRGAGDDDTVDPVAERAEHEQAALARRRRPVVRPEQAAE
ncbi:lysylphosphatidylglycerol synthase transmembrane domain-containing protein [Rhodococcus chondri]|uniref:YbhN family protein n=1 Tax=Rhodococcus chondri TaxID=3065941 RepID=A0ABU7JR52_9NOCA|nr:YbhN family protein [Rhodococcus sp. CC-R104]MEE2031797.1 YbhN family protein [Rhodococcus sp. CC-R104]